MKPETIIVCGAGGFIGHHLVNRLKDEGFFVIGVDLKYPQFSESKADLFYLKDLRVKGVLDQITEGMEIKEIYQLAADMGGAGYVFTKEHDAHIMYNSVMINLHVAQFAAKLRNTKLFFSSSACIYPERNQINPNNPNCAEETAYPAAPDSEYGWEKLFSERIYQAFQRNYGLDIRIARFHNVFGPEGSWNDGKEKAPAAFCRKIAMAKDGEKIMMWGDGNQTRSFLYIDECLEGVRRLMNYPCAIEPLNIGSEEMVSINQLAEMIMKIAGKKLEIEHIPGPLGVRGRCSDNVLIYRKLHWMPDYPLKEGLKKNYDWIYQQIYGK